MTFFYESQEKELLDAVVELEELVKQQEEVGVEGPQYFDDASEEDDDDEDEPGNSPVAARTPDGSWPPRRRRRRSSAGRTYVGGMSSYVHTSQYCLLYLSRHHPRRTSSA